MTKFDWYILCFLPVAVVLIIIQFYLNDWSFEKVMFEEEDEE